MATVFYDKAAVEVTHNGVSEQLLATDCSLSFSSAQAPLYAIGSKGTLGQFPAGARQGDLVEFPVIGPTKASIQVGIGSNLIGFYQDFGGFEMILKVFRVRDRFIHRLTTYHRFILKIS